MSTEAPGPLQHGGADDAAQSGDAGAQAPGLIEEEISADYGVFSSSSTKITLAIIGDERCAKAQLLHSFDSSQRQKKLQIDNENYDIILHSNAGMENFFGLTDALSVQAQGLVFVYNSCLKETLERFTADKEAFLRSIDRTDIPILILGFQPFVDEGQSDQEEQVSTKQGMRVAKKHACQFSEIKTHTADSSITRKQLGERVEEIVFNFTRDVIRFNSASQSQVQDDKETNKLPEFNIMVTGDTYTGKTTFVKWFTSGTFNPRYEETRATSSHLGNRFQHEDESAIINLIDTWGAAESFSRELCQTIQALIMVVSAVATDSLSRAERIYERILQGKGVTSIPTVLVLTKNDCEDVSVTREAFEQFASRVGFIPLSLSLTTDLREETIYPSIARLLKELRKAQANPIAVIGDSDKTGELSKTNKSLRKFSPKVCVIQSGTIYITTDGVVTPKSKSMSLANGSFEVLPSDPVRKIFPFEIRSADKSLFFSASTETARAEWIDTIILNLAYDALASSVLEDVIKASLWEVSVELKTGIANGTETLQPVEVPGEKKEEKKKRGFSMFKKKSDKEKPEKPEKPEKDKKKK